MKAIVLAICLMLSSTLAWGQIEAQEARNNVGMTFVRLVNHNPVPVSCYYQDRFNYFTFMIYPHSTSRWIPTYGFFQWACK